MTILAEVFYADKQRLRDSISYECDPKGIITAIKMDSGIYQELSSYEDNVWILPHHWFPESTKDSQRSLNFTRITCQSLRKAAKVIMARQLWGENAVTKNKRGNTYVYDFRTIIWFFNWLSSKNINNTTEITPMVAHQYIVHVKGIRVQRVKRKGLPLSSNTKNYKLSAIEASWRWLRDTIYSFEHPWPESSAAAISGHNPNRKEAQTLIIPDSILAPLTQYAQEKLNGADELIEHRNAISRLALSEQDRANHSNYKSRCLKLRGWQAGVREFNKAIFELRDCCFLLILLTTGMRSHELLNIKRDRWYSEVRDGERFFYIGSRSDKTHEGNTHWLCPELAINSLKILERLSASLQLKLVEDLYQAIDDEDHVEYARLNDLSGCLALSECTSKKNKIVVISNTALIKTLQSRVDSCGLDWHLTPHQLRRTFANYVVHHKLGDLRYLRDHFKHWSLDMSALYAMNKQQDLDLYDDIYAAFDDVRQGIIGHWLEPDTPLSGGLAKNIRNLRGKNKDVRTFKSRKDMIKKISEHIFLRATSLAWCTNDDGSCGGGQCEECEHGVIDDKKQGWWEAVYAQQIELRLIEDIGESGNQTVERAILRCEKVLADLGADVENIKRKVVANVRRT